MGLFQNACLTYDNNTDRIGVYEAGKEPLAPVGHIVTTADLELTIDLEGHFIRSSARSRDESKVIIPVTEESAGGRSSTKVAPHSLDEQLGYLAAYDTSSKKKQSEYLSQLLGWINYEPNSQILRAIYKYVSRNTILQDLASEGTIRLTEDGSPKNSKLFVVWRISGISEPCVWKNKELMNSYSNYCKYKAKQFPHGVCMVSGMEEPLISKHMKGVYSLRGNAKLISANDSQNFTYRGRFLNPEEALTVGYAASQKAHNALKWLLSNQKVVMGGRAFLCWSPQRVKLPGITNSLLKSLLGEDIPEMTTFAEYRETLSKVLNGYQTALSGQLSETVIAGFDAATTGRLAVTFYSEMPTDQFLKSLQIWDESCCWYSGKLILSPALNRVVETAFGVERDGNGKGKLEVDDKIKKQQIERMIKCRIGSELFPSDIETRLVQNASDLMKYGSISRQQVLSTACAAIRKYRYDHGKGEESMNLEKKRKDRSYQFGRLLAVYEKIERDTFGPDDTREPNAIQWQSAYCNQPMHYAFELDKQMERAYYPRLNPGTRVFYKNLVGEIMAVINEFPEKTWNSPLKDTYLMGYFLQRKDLYTKKDAKDSRDGTAPISTQSTH